MIEQNFTIGIKGIMQLFKVSSVTARKLKNGVIKDACYQVGRKILVDKDKAIELFIKASKEGR